MVWDLRAALLKKEEFESARLMDFEFRLRARAFRLLAEQYQLPVDQVLEWLALYPDESILERLCAERGLLLSQVQSAYAAATKEARGQLIAERGDPTPHRLG